MHNTKSKIQLKTSTEARSKNAAIFVRPCLNLVSKLKSAHAPWHCLREWALKLKSNHTSRNSLWEQALKLKSAHTSWNSSESGNQNSYIETRFEACSHKKTVLGYGLWTINETYQFVFRRHSILTFLLFFSWGNYCIMDVITIWFLHMMIFSSVMFPLWDL
jgi:hypothetical protein